MTALVVYLQNTLFSLKERQEGQPMAEYALILGGIAVVVIAAIVFLGGRIDTGCSAPPARPSRTRSAARRPRVISCRGGLSDACFASERPPRSSRGRFGADRTAPERGLRGVTPIEPMRENGDVLEHSPNLAASLGVPRGRGEP